MEGMHTIHRRTAVAQEGDGLSQLVEEYKSFVTYSAADWRAAAGERPPFLVDGVISKEVTLVYGKSEAGKSMLVAGTVAAMVSGQGSFIGREVQQQRWDVGILVGDYGDGRRYSGRIEAALPDRQAMSRVRIYDPTRKGMPFYGWEELAGSFRSRGHNLLVVDNLSAFVPGDINNGPACEAFFNALTAFTAQDISVIVVAHSTEKHSQFGTQDFMGNSAIRQRPSWHCRVRKSGDRKTLYLHGNDAGNHEITVRQANGEVPLFDVVSAVDAEALADRQAKRQRERSDQRKGESDQIRDFVLRECQGDGVRATAKRLAPKFGGAEGTHRNRLSSGAYGVKLSQDGQWESTRQAA